MILVRRIDRKVDTLDATNTAQHAVNSQKVAESNNEVLSRLSEHRGALDWMHRDLKQDITGLDVRVGKVESRVGDIESQLAPAPLPPPITGTTENNENITAALAETTAHPEA